LKDGIVEQGQKVENVKLGAEAEESSRKML
jgi:hypothetical protein